MSVSEIKSIYIYYKMLSECYDLIAFGLQERELKIFEKRSFLFKIVHPTAAICRIHHHDVPNRLWGSAEQNLRLPLIFN